ncbi:MAG: AAA family ATPase [Thermofilum sp.]|jgi:hypothetical protein|uniref:hypothetical protein n=1 Tax=Thermofilum sp. TaxID=1961369 RepID=UPI0025834CD0|nr:hypothetical protein [Thermofilum sp.]MCI4409301.1 AAA family ATPase [Thermofilum sp.]
MSNKLKLYISKIGPINNAEIEIGDITVFIGKPNSGKSLALKSIFNSLYCSNRFIYLKGNRLEIKDDELVQEFGVDYGKSLESYERFVRNSVPSGTFALEPIDIKRFITNYRANYRGEFELDNEYPIYLPKPCSGNDIIKIRRIINNSVYEININGNRGEVRVMGNFSEISGYCLNDSVTRAILSDIIIKIVENFVGSIYCDEFKKLLKEKGIGDVVYLPNVRSALTLHKLITGEIKKRSELILSLDYNFSIAGLNYVTEFYKRLGNYDERVFRLVKPLLKGEIREENGNLVYIENGNIIPWEYVSGSVLELLSLLLSVKPGDLVLYEDPETGLHERLQTLIGILIYGLSSTNKFILSTNGQSVFYTIVHMYVLRPTRNELTELFEKLGLTNYNALLEAVEDANKKNVELKIYYFDDGNVKEIGAEEALRGMPGTIDDLVKVLNWLSSLHSKRIFGGE